MSEQLNGEQGSHGGYIVLLRRLRTLSFGKQSHEFHTGSLDVTCSGQVLIWNTGRPTSEFP